MAMPHPARPMLPGDTLRFSLESRLHTAAQHPIVAAANDDVDEVNILGSKLPC